MENAVVISVKDFLVKQKKLTIPNLQRGYVWGKDQWKQLCYV